MHLNTNLFISFQPDSSSLLPDLEILWTTGLVTSVYERSGSLIQNSKHWNWKKNFYLMPTFQNKSVGNWREIWTSQNDRSKFGFKIDEWRVKRITKEQHPDRMEAIAVEVAGMAVEEEDMEDTTMAILPTVES